MRTTLDLDAALLEDACRETGIAGKTAVIEAGLRSLLERAAIRRLVALKGRMPAARAPRRRRTPAPARRA